LILAKLFAKPKCILDVATFATASIQKQDYKTALRKYRKSMRYLDLCWEKEDIDEGSFPFFSSLLSLFIQKLGN